jgi:hypothetical protein
MPHLLLAQIDRKQKNSTAMVEELDAFLRLEPDGPRSAGVRAVRDETARALAQDQRSAETVVASGPH